MIRRYFQVVVFGFAAGVATDSLAQSDPPEQPDESLEFNNTIKEDPNSGWRFEITPYIWLPEMDGQIGVGSLDAPVNVDIPDWLRSIERDELDVVFKARIDARRGDWGFFSDFLYISLESSDEGTLTTISYEVEQFIYEFGASYRLWAQSAAPAEQDPASFDLYAGGRYSNITADVEIGLNGLPGSSLRGGLDEDWLDPMIGLRVIYPMSDRFTLLASTDAGGFGVGSDLTWSLTTVVEYNVTRNFSLNLGYRVLDVDYDHGSGDDRFVFDVQMRGPMFGMTFRF